MTSAMEIAAMIFSSFVVRYTTDWDLLLAFGKSLDISFGSQGKHF
jgi:hypothetical protein